MLTRIACCVALLALGAATTAQAHEPGEARYLGNEGVLVRHGDHGVLFDALFVDTLGTYLVPDAATRIAMDRGTTPFEHVDAVFVTHAHADHFDAIRMLQFLRARPEAHLYGPVAVGAALRRAGAKPDELARITTFDIRPGDAAAAVNGPSLSIEAVAVPHSGPDRFPGLQHLVYRVTVGDGPTITHLGDADAEVTHFANQRDHWQRQTTDLALPPYWFFLGDSGREILARHLNARDAVGVHVPARAQIDPHAFRTELGGDAFVTPGETRSIPHAPRAP